MTGPRGRDDPVRRDMGRVLRLPAGFSPRFSDVRADSELLVLAASEVVFARLVTVSSWERVFSGVRNARIAAPGRGQLEPDSEFEFEMDGLRLRARISEFAADSRLAWIGQGIDISAYHAWVVSGGLGRSRVLAGFAAIGAAAIALRETDPGAAQRTLDRWVDDLKKASESVGP